MLSVHQILLYLLRCNKPLVPEEEIANMLQWEELEWQKYAEECKGMIVTSPGMVLQRNVSVGLILLIAHPPCCLGGCSSLESLHVQPQATVSGVGGVKHVAVGEPFWVHLKISQLQPLLGPTKKSQSSQQAF